jgi:hypothetical protein
MASTSPSTARPSASRAKAWCSARRRWSTKGCGDSA